MDVECPYCKELIKLLNDWRNIYDSQENGILSLEDQNEFEKNTYNKTMAFLNQEKLYKIPPPPPDPEPDETRCP